MEFIFEIGCEELPARFVPAALDQLRDLFAEAALDARLTHGAIRIMGTPRRLTLLVDDLAPAASDLQEERTGPPARAAFRDGEPTKAALGFARGQGVAVEDLYLVETEKGEYVAAKVFEEGKPAHEILPALLEGILAKLNFPKSMRWADLSLSFARPVRWIVAVAGGQLIPVTFASVSSQEHTYGHRFAAPEAIEVQTIAGYLSDLRAAQVEPDPALRRATIEAALQEHGAQVGGQVIDDPELVEEVTYLVEKPFAVTLPFSEAYLELPPEVLISSMRSHQRYFAIEKADGSGLMAACVIIYNTPVRDPRVVAQGNLRVLKARLDDARFFWDRDLKTPLAARLAELESVVWLAKVGTMKERTERIGELAGRVGQALGLEGQSRDDAERAGLLSKADLVTQMVFEFTDLQGVMGRAYALKSGERPEVAQAIYEQYLPGGSGQDMPASVVGAAVAIAEKLDAIVGCFGIGLVPSSTADPYGLRRSALGVLRVLDAGGYPVALGDLVDQAIDTYQSQNPGVLTTGAASLKGQVKDFLVTRLRFLLMDDAPTDVVDAVLAAGVEDIPSVRGRVEALAGLRDQADFEPLAIGFKRVVNILNKQAENLPLATRVDASLLQEDAEQTLFEAFTQTREKVDQALANADWPGACARLIELKAPVDRFFDEVMVMADDEAVRHNRLALLAGLRELFFGVADISKIQA
ncbi:glycine--tRNA ligase subunit beta [Lujinxingia litoralis]|uniref:Glycine--tRNA ligase beta subunit n=1 Tax=Lujinxingia litoralis TaxID=2211119 RepID=A0A328C600_9DELT|nr:glycine--tRNA ligase subunit beta [Lujinxingia litoralis]RAL22252.1 glycine--tRNA ligase subunit beta [Lujinxingia litoralis]